MASAPQPPPPPRAPRRGIYVGSVGALLVVGLIVLVVLAIGYVTVVAVFGIPWYAALPLSLLAGAGVVLWESSFSLKAWLVAGVLVAVAVASALGWAISSTAG